MPSRFSNRDFWLTMALVLATVIALLIIVWLVWQWWNLPSRTVPALSFEAMRDPWLGTSQLLDMHGIDVKQDSPFSDENTPATTDTVLIDGGVFSVGNPIASSEIQNWVTAGGTLIYRVDDNPQKSNIPRYKLNFFPINLGVYRNVSYLFFDEIVDFGSCPPPTHLRVEDSSLERLQISKTARSSFEYQPNLYQNPIENLAENTVLKANFGKGKIFFVQSVTHWHNLYVACHDNAFILMNMISDWNTSDSGLDRKTLWIMPWTEYPRFWQLIWDHAAPVVLGIALALLISLFVWNIRLAPARYQVATVRRSAYAYAFSSAQFSWRNKSIRPLLLTMSKLVVGKKSGTDFDRLITKTAQNLGTSESSVHEALQSISSDTESTLITRVRVLQAMYRIQFEQHDRPKTHQ